MHTQGNLGVHNLHVLEIKVLVGVLTHKSKLTIYE